MGGRVCATMGTILLNVEKNKINNSVIVSVKDSLGIIHL
jgi:hypothetical protein